MSSTEQTLEFNKIYNKLLPSINRMFNSYSFLGLTNEQYIKLIKSFLLEIYQKNSKEGLDIESYLKKLKTYIDVYIKMSLKDSSTTNRIINNFINKKLNISTTAKENISQIQKLSSFLEKYEYIPTPDACVELIQSNPILSKLLKDIIDKNLDYIKRVGVEALDSSVIFITLIDVFCMLNNIEYKKEEIDEEIEFDSSVLDQLGAYLIEIQKPLLSAEEEKELAMKAAQGDSYAREKLIERNLKWVVRIARGYQNRGMELAELIQEGNVGLITAVDKFDYTKGYRLTTYSMHWIRQAIGRAIQEKAKAIRLPVHIEEKISKYRRTYIDLEKKLNRAPTIEELAKVLKTSVSSIEEILSYQHETVSLNSQIGDEEDTELANFIPSPESSPEEQYEKVELPEALQAILLKCNLKEREMAVLLLRSGIVGGNPKTLEEIGQMYGVTRERIRQIENKALKKIRRSSTIVSLAQLTSNPKRAMQNISTYREFYNTFTNSLGDNRSLQRKDTSQLHEEIQEVQQQDTTCPSPPIMQSISPPQTPTKEVTLKKIPTPSRAMFTIFDKFTQLGYTREEVLSVIPELSNQDKKRLNLRNGQDLDNPVISPFITEKDRNLYITKTLPTIEELLKNKYGPRVQPQSASPKKSIYDEIAASSTIKSQCREFTFPQNVKELLEKSNLLPKEVEILMARNGFLYDCPKTQEEICLIYGVTRARLNQIEASALKKLKSSNYYNFFVHQMNNDKSLQNLENISQFQKILDLTQAIQTQMELQTTLFEFFEIYGYTKEEVLSVINELPEKDKLRIKLINGDDLDNPTSSKYVTFREKEIYETTTIPKIKTLLKNKYGPREKQKTPIKNKKQVPQKEENDMAKNAYTIFEYFRLFGYTKEEVKELLLKLTDKEKEFVEARNGADYLNNPVYNKTVTQSQRIGYTRLLNRMLAKLKEKYGDRKVSDVIIEGDDLAAKPNNQVSEQVLTETDEQIVPSPIALASDTQPLEVTSTSPVEAVSTEKKSKGRKNKKTIFQKFIALGYKREEVEAVLKTLTKNDLNTIYIIDGTDLDNPCRSVNATRKDDSKYHSYVLPKIKKRLEKIYGSRLTQTQETVTEKENTPAETSFASDTEEQIKNQPPIIKEQRSEVTEDSTTKNISEEPITKQPAGEVIASETSGEKQQKEMTKTDYIRILELLKTVEFEQLMQTLGPEKATIIALRLGYVKGKYYSVEAIANFLDIEQSEVIEITEEILNMYKSRLNNIIDTAITHLQTEGPIRKLTP